MPNTGPFGEQGGDALKTKSNSIVALGSRPWIVLYRVKIGEGGPWMVIALHRSPESGLENVVIKHIPWVIRHIIKFLELRTVKSLEAKPKKNTTSTILPSQKPMTRIKHGKIDGTQQSWPWKKIELQAKFGEPGVLFRGGLETVDLFFPSGPGRGQAGLFPEPRWRCSKN